MSLIHKLIIPIVVSVRVNNITLKSMKHFQTNILYYRNRSVSMHDIGQPAYKNAQNYPMRQFQNNNNVPGYYGNNQRSNKH